MTNLDRSSDAERTVLGAVLLDNAVWPKVAVLRDHDFSLDSHRRIFSRMRELADAGSPIEPAALAAELDRHRELGVIGGHPYLSTLTDGVIPASVGHYVAIIQESARRREFSKGVEQAHRLASDPTVSTTVLAEMALGLSQVAGGKSPLPPRFSEEALALRFSRQYGDALRYVARWDRWMRWDGMRWCEDDTLDVFDHVRAVCRAASAECGDGKKGAAQKLAAAATVAAVERLTRADRRHAATVDQWDRDQWLLNTPAGAVDLRTGILRPNRRRTIAPESQPLVRAAIARCGWGFSIVLPTATQSCNHSCSA